MAGIQQGARHGMGGQRARPVAGALAGLLTLWGGPGANAQAPARPAAAPAASAPAMPREWRYRVATGDTLIGLAAAHLTDPTAWPALQQLNQVSNPRRLVPGSTLRIPYALLRRESTVAEVVFVQGQVSLLRAGAEALPALKAGDALRPADSLRTGPGASLSLRFADGTRLLVVPDSRVTLEQLLVYGRSGIVDTRVRVDQGSADSQVMPNAAGSPAYEVRTPAVNLGVRGTDFRVRVDADGVASRVEVLSGSVAAEREAPTLVAAGFGTLAVPDQPVEPPRPLLPAPRLAAQVAEFVELPFTLAWAPVAGARGYRAQVFAEGQAGALVLDGNFDGTQAQWADGGKLPDGRYLFRVRALDEAGLEGLDANRRVVLAARPFAPPPEQPAPGEVVVADLVSLTWAESAGVSGYRVQVARQGDFSPPLADQVVAGRSLQLRLEPGSYTWRVAGVPARPDARANGPFGAVQAFELRAAPPLPERDPPQLGPTRLLLRWRPLAAGQGAQVQVARDAAFSDLLLDERTEGAEIALPRPPAGAYHWRLRSLIAGRPVGDFSPAEGLRVPGLSWWERLWLPPSRAAD